MRRQRRAGWSGWSLMIAALPAAAYGAPAPLLHHTFEESASGWMGFGTNSKAAITREAARVKEGKAALRFDYSVGKGEMGSLLLPATDAALAKAKSFRFWVRADAVTTLSVALQEKNGGRYAALFTAPKDTWQRVEIALSDFILNQDKDDPKDPNNRLDIDQVDGVGILDLALLFAQIEEPTIRDLLGVQPGPHTLYLDEFTVSEEALPEPAASSGEVRLDHFDRPQLQWLAVGDVLLSSAGEGRTDKGLKADYTQGPGKFAGFARALHPGKLSGMHHLRLTVASARPTEIIVQLEERSGGKYNKQISIPGDSKVQKLSLTFSEFTAASDSTDDNARLDLDQVKQLLILDMSGFTGAEEGDNVFRVSDLVVAPASAGK